MNGRNYRNLAAQVLARCDALARCTDDPGRITRLFCSPAMREAHRLVGAWMESAGMTLRIDAAANLIGAYRSLGCDPQRRIIIGSHLDSVVDAGRYDGVLGVMMGIAVVESLRGVDARLPWAIDVVGFSDEEGVRFGAPFIGSRALAGTLDQAMLDLRDADGQTMAEALTRFGADLSRLAAAALSPADVVAYLEPHIEQGPLLEALGEPMGVVTAIAGQTRLSVTWTGPGGHAGTTPMLQRKDPLVAAARWISEVERVGCSANGLVATVGRVDVTPNTSNCIPRQARLSLDVRHAADAVRDAAVRELTDLARRIAVESQLHIEIQDDHQHRAVAMDSELTAQLAAVAQQAGYQPQTMASGAGHDAGVIAGVAPAAMLFLRCPGGLSHHPEEAVDAADVGAGLEVLTRFIEQCALRE